MSKYNFDDSFISIENEDEQIRKVSSPWGNSFVNITLEDVEALKAGKVLCHDDGGYCTFVKLKQTGDIHETER